MNDLAHAPRHFTPGDHTSTHPEQPEVILAVPPRIVGRLATTIGMGKLRVVGQDDEGRILLAVVARDGAGWLRRRRLHLLQRRDE